MRAASVALAFSLAAQVAAGEIDLDLPLDCTYGETCYIQRYVDLDPGPGVRDYRCGDLAGDSHNGTDFALHTLEEMRRGVPVLASAPGRVRATRDGMPDRAFSAADEAALNGRDCGNGVVLVHEDGWETQYCHLKRDSIAVKRGDIVDRGDRLGLVGLSGRSNFPHVHLSVRHNGAEIDPFRPEPGETCAPSQRTLWNELPEYSPGGVIYAGFADHVPTLDTVADGTVQSAPLVRGSAALVLYALAYGGHAGDVMRLTIDGPQGNVLETDMVLEKSHPRLFRAAGKRLTEPAWPGGTYQGTVILLREGTELGRRGVQLNLP
ncbi:M23 family metallopeptidase [Microbulbifer sp. S227A]|uniref:M23 family metallopeptidase n=1 Tax=Microbulbifer sp. S227A TaxID=3415131 RepID=UPI003C7E5E76